MITGLQGGAKGELNLGALLTKRAGITAMGLRGGLVRHHVAECVVSAVRPLCRPARRSRSRPRRG